jgi:RNA polymerase sigma factor (sigma-70 family)
MDAPTYRYTYPYPSPYLHPATTPRDWPVVFARVSLGDFELTAELDAGLSAQALRAKTEPDARDELFVQLAGKIMRFAARFDGWAIEPFDADDVRQECYLVYVETLRRWQPAEPSAPRGYGAWFLRVYPLWLANSVARLRVRRVDVAVDTPHAPSQAERADPSDDLAAVELVQALAKLCARLSARDCHIVQLCIAGTPVSHVAGALGVSRRAVHRGLTRIARQARGAWAEREAS